MQLIKLDLQPHIIYILKIKKMIHILDWIMYFVLYAIIWFFILPKDFRYELGIILGWSIMFTFTIIYVAIFCFYDWIDIFNGISVLKIKFKL